MCFAICNRVGSSFPTTGGRSLVFVRVTPSSFRCPRKIRVLKSFPLRQATSFADCFDTVIHCAEEL